MIWDNLDDLEKKEKIDIICKDLLVKLDKIEDWERVSNGSGVVHKTYNLEVYGHYINQPYSVLIPRKWRRKIKQLIKKIYHQYSMNSLHFLHDVILDKYPLHVRVCGENDKKEWIEENAKEDDYVERNYWYYFKNESIAVAFKLRWM